MHLEYKSLLSIHHLERRKMNNSVISVFYSKIMEGVRLVNFRLLETLYKRQTGTSLVQRLRLCTSNAGWGG